MWKKEKDINGFQDKTTQEAELKQKMTKIPPECCQFEHLQLNSELGLG